MPLLKILIFPDPRLRTVAKAVEKVDDSLKKQTCGGLSRAWLPPSLT